MAVCDAHVFPGFLTPVLTKLFFPKPRTTLLTCFCRGERQKYTRKKSHLNWGSTSQPPGHESNTLTSEPPGWDRKRLYWDQNLDLSKLKAFADHINIFLVKHCFKELMLITCIICLFPAVF